MFDPTIYENIKVAMENRIYDLDNLTGEIVVTGRKDLLDQAVMSKQFTLRFVRKGYPEIAAEICLEANLTDLAAEILEWEKAEPGCLFTLRFYMHVEQNERQCSRIEAVLNEIWEPELRPRQKLSYIYNQYKGQYLNEIELGFESKINEEHIGEIPRLLEHIVLTLERLREV
ncbi:hypothetical protein [Paenibacillus turpanensis]|uniref:hypothetical protein n=1 Tax=Paenibacillus turpanensis TaxID=2689078 RepID=UPI001408DF65|nr:hypothetical protein [Paenibacillus turpanensis]